MSAPAPPLPPTPLFRRKGTAELYAWRPGRLAFVGTKTSKHPPVQHTSPPEREVPKAPKRGRSSPASRSKKQKTHTSVQPLVHVTLTDWYVVTHYAKQRTYNSYYKDFGSLRVKVKSMAAARREEAVRCHVS